MLVASTSVAMVASVHPTEKNSARSSSRHVHCRHRQISSRRASERAVFNAQPSWSQTNSGRVGAPTRFRNRLVYSPSSRD